jgi:hypothetical protein
MGLSRRPAAVLAYLCHRGLSLRRAIRVLQRGVCEEEGFTEPHEAFLEQLRDFFDLAEDEGE